ncbi:MAG: hypothetical protein HKN30_16095 [Sulfitobacter sp.]|nr:hypothetical protein [Sulfitobacter sp.]
MTPTESLIPIVLLLALVGYIWCLSRAPMPSLFLTAICVLYLSTERPFDATQITFWAPFGATVAVALAVSLFLRRKEGTGTTFKTKSRPTGREIVIDGTNVMYWDGEADLRVLRSVVDYLKAKEFAPYVFLDASSRHHLKDKSLDEARFSKALGLPKKRVMVCPAKTEADAFILRFASEEGLPVVSNDRFGDRAHQAQGLKLIKGIFADGRPILEGL